MASIPTRTASRVVISAVCQSALTKHHAFSAVCPQSRAIRLASTLSTGNVQRGCPLSVSRRCVVTAAAESNGTSPTSPRLGIDLRGESSKRAADLLRPVPRTALADIAFPFIPQGRRLSWLEWQTMGCDATFHTGSQRYCSSDLEFHTKILLLHLCRALSS